MRERVAGIRRAPGFRRVRPAARQCARRAALEPLEPRVLLSTVAGRFVFYNNSALDGNDPAADARDRGAIATDKVALLPGQSATFANYTSYTRGITGVAVDLSDAPGELSASNFVFKAGLGADPAAWSAAPAPAQIVRLAPAAGSATARYLITWDDNAIRGQWLQVTVKADATTGLAAPDVFYFGNIPGETGDRPGDATVDAQDVARVRQRSGNGPAGASDPCDFNRDGRVNVLDQAVARGGVGKPALPLLAAPELDIIAPSVAITAPAGGSSVTATVTVSASASDNVGVAGVQFLLDDVPLGVEDAVAPYSVLWDTTPLANGSYELTAVARDAAGNVTFSEVINVTVAHPDVTAPIVSITAPANGATVDGNLAITADATDNVGVAGVRFLLNGASLGDEDTTAPYSITWDSTTVANGMYQLAARARDSAGNSSTSAAMTVTVNNPDVTAPTVSMTAPADNATVFGTAAVSADAFDNIGIAGVQFLRNGGPLGAEDTTAPYTITWDTTTSPNGTYEIKAVARDAAGNSTTSSWVTVTVNNPDVAAPTVSLTAPANNATVNGQVALAADASDNISVLAVQFLLDGVPLGAEDTGAPYSIVWDSTTAQNGSHQLAARARDAAGNVTTSTAVTVTVNNPDITAPTVSVTAPADSGTVDGVVTLSATAADNVGVAGVQFLVDGAPFGDEDTTAPYSVTWDTTAAANGGHQIGAVARDAAGNAVTSVTVNVIVANPDTTAPDVSLTAPAANATVNGDVVFSANASDNVAVVAVQFLVDGAPVGGEDTAAPYLISWDSRTVGDGVHAVTARARDAAGNVTTSAPRSVTVANSPTGPAVIGQWSSVINWPLVAINQVLLKDGRILMWDGDGSGGCEGSSSGRIWDPITGQFTPVPIPYFLRESDDIFCAGQTVLADGRVLVVGGHDCDGPELGIKMSNIFDPVTMTWTRGPDMAIARWYPTATTLSDGRVLVLGGTVNTNDDYVTIPEIYDPVTNTFSQLSAANLAIPSYSWVFQLPDGRVIVTGSDEQKMPTYALDLTTQTWSTVDPAVMDHGSGVMYRPGLFMKAGSSYIGAPQDNGGAVPSKPSTYVLDMTPGAAQPPLWQQTASMANGRTHLNLTLLPDGNVLATGGSQDIGGLTASRGVLAPELWSPATRTWTTMASMQVPRMYHSTALLLPDGRVLSAGGGRLADATSNFNAEVYSPAYLFKGPRPVIVSTPSTLTYGAAFFVGTPDGADIALVALVRNSSVTHSFNMDQRYVPLAFTATSGGLNVQAPDGDTAPPGYYMLFIVNSNGVPSVAPFVRFAAPYEDSQAPTAPTGVTASGTLGGARVRWNASTDNIAVTGYNVYRSTAPGFTPASQNLVGTTTSRTFTDTLVPGGTYYYVVRAFDAAGNLSPASNEATVEVTADLVAPTVSVIAPAGGAVAAEAVVLEADASDDVGVFGVRFFIDGVQVGGEITAAPYAFTWPSTSVANGNHTITAVARDLSGNATTSAPVVVNVQNVLPSGLVAAWAFNEGSGSLAHDSTVNGHTGTIFQAQWAAVGRFGGALSFNGFNSWVTVANSPLLMLAAGMTLEAWVYLDNIDGFETVILKERGTDTLSYTLYAHDPDRRPVGPGGYARTTDGETGAGGSTPLPLNTWVHLATTYDGANVRTYADGVLLQATPLTGNISNTSDVLRMGGNAVWGEFLEGMIDEVRIYNRALTRDEILADRLTPLPGVAAAPAAMAAASVATIAAFPPGTFADEPLSPRRVWDEPPAAVL